jgi:hypothetical protein
MSLPVNNYGKMYSKHTQSYILSHKAQNPLTALPWQRLYHHPIRSKIAKQQMITSRHLLVTYIDYTSWQEDRHVVSNRKCNVLQVALREMKIRRETFSTEAIQCNQQCPKTVGVAMSWVRRDSRGWEWQRGACSADVSGRRHLQYASRRSGSQSGGECSTALTG